MWITKLPYARMNEKSSEGYNACFRYPKTTETKRLPKKNQKQSFLQSKKNV